MKRRGFLKALGIGAALALAPIKVLASLLPQKRMRYDKKTNTIMLTGGTKNDPITVEEIHKAFPHLMKKKNEKQWGRETYDSLSNLQIGDGATQTDVLVDNVEVDFLDRTSFKAHDKSTLTFRGDFKATEEELRRDGWSFGDEQ